MRFVFPVLLCIALVLVSCSTPLEPQNDILKIEFQNGVWPAASYAGCEDTYISSGTQTTNYAASVTLYAGQNGTDTFHTLIKFDMTPLVPQNVTVVKAYLTLSMPAVTSYLAGYTVYDVASGWIVDNATWVRRITNGNLLWTTQGGDLGPAAGADTRPDAARSTITFEIAPSLVEEWLEITNIDRGVFIRSTTEDGADHQINFLSSEYGTGTSRPKLTVYYRLP